VTPAATGAPAEPVTDPRAANGPDEPPVANGNLSGSAPAISEDVTTDAPAPMPAPAPRPPQNLPRPPQNFPPPNPPGRTCPVSAESQQPFQGRGGPRPPQQQRGPSGRQQGGQRPMQQPGVSRSAAGTATMRIRPLPRFPRPQELHRPHRRHHHPHHLRHRPQYRRHRMYFRKRRQQERRIHSRSSFMDHCGLRV